MWLERLGKVFQAIARQILCKLFETWKMSNLLTNSNEFSNFINHCKNIAFVAKMNKQFVL